MRSTKLEKTEFMKDLNVYHGVTTGIPEADTVKFIVYGEVCVDMQMQMWSQMI